MLSTAWTRLKEEHGSREDRLDLMEKDGERKGKRRRNVER